MNEYWSHVYAWSWALCNSDNEVFSLTDNQSRGKVHLVQWQVADGGLGGGGLHIVVRTRIVDVKVSSILHFEGMNWWLKWFLSYTTILLCSKWVESRLVSPSHSSLYQSGFLFLYAHSLDNHHCGLVGIKGFTVHNKWSSSTQKE